MIIDYLQALLNRGGARCKLKLTRPDKIHTKVGEKHTVLGLSRDILLQGSCFQQVELVECGMKYWYN